MKEQRLADALGKVDDKFVEEAAPVNKKRKKSIWTRWAAIAACLVIIIGGAFVWKNMNNEDSIATNDTAAYGFTMNDCIYFPISFEERREFGLVPENAMGLTEENTYKITKDDLGEVMGTVEDCGDERLIGAAVYHFASYPESDAICIVEYGGNYNFYTTYGPVVELQIGDSSDIVMDAYGLPESVIKLTVLGSDWETYVTTITEKETIAAVCKLMSGKENIGLVEKERLLGELWYDTYGNDDVYFSEEDGFVRVRQSDIEPSEPVEYTDEFGNTVVYQYDGGIAEEEALWQKAYDLWDEGGLTLIFTTQNGFDLEVIYQPSIAVIGCYDGYYSLTDSETQKLNELLGVN